MPSHPDRVRRNYPPECKHTLTYQEISLDGTFLRVICHDCKKVVTYIDFLNAKAPSSAPSHQDP